MRIFCVIVPHKVWSNNKRKEEEYNFIIYKRKGEAVEFVDDISATMSIKQIYAEVSLYRHNCNTRLIVLYYPDSIQHNVANIYSSI